VKQAFDEHFDSPVIKFVEKMSIVMQLCLLMLLLESKNKDDGSEDCSLSSIQKRMNNTEYSLTMAQLMTLFGQL
jgi:hypothetical protein